MCINCRHFVAPVRRSFPLSRAYLASRVPWPSGQGKRRSLRVWGWGENCLRKRIAKTTAERRKHVSKSLLIRQLRVFGSLGAPPGTPAPLGNVHKRPSAIAAARLWNGGLCCLPASRRCSAPSAKETVSFEWFFLFLPVECLFFKEIEGKLLLSLK